MQVLIICSVILVNEMVAAQLAAVSFEFVQLYTFFKIHFSGLLLATQKHLKI